MKPREESLYRRKRAAWYYEEVRSQLNDTVAQFQSFVAQVGIRDGITQICNWFSHLVQGFRTPTYKVSPLNEDAVHSVGEVEPEQTLSDVAVTPVIKSNAPGKSLKFERIATDGDHPLSQLAKDVHSQLSNDSRDTIKSDNDLYDGLGDFEIKAQPEQTRLKTSTTGLKEIELTTYKQSLTSLREQTQSEEKSDEKIAHKSPQPR